MYNLALLSFHGCPVARLGEKDTGGMNVYVLQLAREYARRGNRVDVYTRCHDPLDPQIVELAKGARVIHLNAGSLHEPKENLHEYVPEFVEELFGFQQSEGVRYDLIHSHYWLSGLAGLILGQRWDIPHISTFHTLAKVKLRARAGEKESELRVSGEGRVIDFADSLVVSTEQEKEDLVRLYQAAPHSVCVIPAGVDLELFRPVAKAEARRVLGLSERKVILYVGRVEPLKGLDILLDAVARLDDPADTRLLIVGGASTFDSELKRLRSLTAELGISHMVTFTGAVPQDELPNYYSAADIFVLPSYYESFGLAALEAMACGIPVVASRVGGLKAFIRDGETGYLIPWRCAEPFSQRLDMLLANPALRETMGRAARSKAQEMGWGRVADRMLDHYSSLIGESWERVAGA